MQVNPEKLREKCSAVQEVPQKEIERETGIPQPRLSTAFSFGLITKHHLETLCDKYGFKFEDVEVEND